MSQAIEIASDQAEQQGDRLARGSATSLVLQLAGRGLLFGTHVLLARLLGVAMYGDFAYANAWLEVLTLVGTFGFTTATVRFVSAYRAEERWGLLRGFLQRSLQMTTGLAVVAGLACGLVVLTLAGQMRSTLMWTMVIALSAIPLIVIVDVLSASLRGFQHIGLSLFPKQVMRPLVFVACVLLVLWTPGWELNAITAMLAQVAAWLVLVVVLAVFLRQSVPKAAKEVRAEYLTREWFSVALTCFATALLALVLTRIDVLLLGTIRGTAEAGVYSMAGRLVMLLQLVPVSISTIAAPLTAELHAQNEKNQLTQTIRRVARWTLLATVIIAGALILAGSQLLNLVGTGFTAAYPALVILCVGQAFSALTGPVGMLLNMTGHHGCLARWMTVAAVANLAMNAILIPLAGMVGAAIATTVATVLLNVLLYWDVVRRLGFQPGWLVIGGKAS